MNTHFRKVASAATAFFVLVFLGACATGTNQNFDNYSDPLSGAEVTEVLAGNFLPFGSSDNGTFFAANGALNSLRGGGAIGIGTWGAGDRGLCMEEAVFYRENGAVKAEPPFTNCYFVFKAENGTIIFDPVGMGRNIVLPPGTIRPGFAGRAEFNRLRSDLGV